MSVSVPTCLPACLPACLSAYLPTCLPTCLHACQPPILSSCQPICQFIFLTVIQMYVQPSRCFQNQIVAKVLNLNERQNRTKACVCKRQTSQTRILCSKSEWVTVSINIILFLTSIHIKCGETCYNDDDILEQGLLICGRGHNYDYQESSFSSRMTRRVSTILGFVLLLLKVSTSVIQPTILKSIKLQNTWSEDDFVTTSKTHYFTIQFCF